MFNVSEYCYIIFIKGRLHSGKTHVESMIGDVNLFISVVNQTKIAEVSIMIADSANRGNGYGFEALIHMLQYGIVFFNT